MFEFGAADRRGAGCEVVAEQEALIWSNDVGFDRHRPPTSTHPVRDQGPHFPRLPPAALIAGSFWTGGGLEAFAAAAFDMCHVTRYT